MDLEELARSPKRITTDEGTIIERDIKDVKDAEFFDDVKDVGDEPLHGLRISRCKPAGPV